MVRYNVRPRMGAKGISYMLDISLKDGTRTRETFKTEALAIAAGNRLIKEMDREVAAEVLGIHLHKPAGMSSVIKLSDAIRKHVDLKEAEITKPENMRSFKYIQKYIYEGLHDLGVDYIHEVTLEKVQLLRAAWKKKKHSNTTVNKRIGALRTLLDQCIGWEYIDKNPCDRLKTLADDTKSRQPMTRAEHELICKKLLSYNKGLDWLTDFLQFLFDTGARPIEAIQLTDEDLRHNHVILKTEKGGGDSRNMPLTEKQMAFLKAVIKKRQAKFPFARHIFIDHKGGKIYRNRVSDWVAKARKDCKIKKQVVPYSYRHGFITDLQEMEVGFSKVQELAGHKRGATTKGYTHHADSSLRKVMDLAEERRKRQG